VLYVRPGAHQEGQASDVVHGNGGGALFFIGQVRQHRQYCCELQPIDPVTCSDRPSTMSMAVSLERFDCGALSTPSSPRGLGLDDGDGGAASASSYFDLPLDLILGCDAEDETDLPVCAAFLFDSDGIRKSVLKRRLEAGAGCEPRRPSLGKVSMDAAGRISTPQVRVSLKSRSPAAMWSP
jgi:hypothetical protein